MQLKDLVILSALALFSATPSKSTAQGWATVLDYQLAAGQSADGDGIVADASGNVFSGGNGNDASGTNHGIVLKTDTTQLANADPTAVNWYFSDDSNPSASQYQSYIWDLGLDVGGNLYSIGQLTPIQSSRTPTTAAWYVRKSSDSGLTWTNAGDPYQYTPGQWANAAGFAADDTGNIYVVGWGRDETVVGSGKHTTTQNTIHWLVRKSSDGGANWNLVDDVQGPTSNFGAAGAAFVPGAGVFVVGVPYTISGASWMVRRSLNGELGTWATVGGTFAGAAQAVGSDRQGNIYVAGSQTITITNTVINHNKPVTTTSSYNVWVTRKSSDGGDNFSTVGTFTYAANATAGANGIGRDAAGKVVVVGRAYDLQSSGSLGRCHWIVRSYRSSGDLGDWVTVDDFQLDAGHASAANAVTDAAGNLLVTGNTYDATGGHWIVRRLAAPAP